MTTEADIEPELSDLEISSIENLRHLQPYGEENNAPLFLMRNCTIISSRPLKDGKYTSFTAEYKGAQFKFCLLDTSCGVALKLIMALERDVEGVLEQYADLAAIGTIGDVVALTGENRIIVKRGLLEMQYSENQGLQALINAAGLDAESITSTGIAFGLCPRINAAGDVYKRQYRLSRIQPRYR